MQGSGRDHLESQASPRRQHCMPEPLMQVCRLFPANSHKLSAQINVDWLALGGDLCHAGACGLEGFLAGCMSWPSGNMGRSHATPPRVPAQGSFPAAESRDGSWLSVSLPVCSLLGHRREGWPQQGHAGFSALRVLHGSEWHDFLLGGRRSPRVWLRGPQSGGLGGQAPAG